MPSFMRSSSPAVASRKAASATGRKSPGSSMTSMRTGMCPTLAPKLMSDSPLRWSYQESMSPAPTSSSSAVVTPSLA